MRRAGGAQDSSLALEMGDEWNSSPILVTLWVMNFGILEFEISIATWDFNTPISPYSVRDEGEGQERSQKQSLFALGCISSLPSLQSTLPGFPLPPAILIWKSQAPF